MNRQKAKVKDSAAYIVAKHIEGITKQVPRQDEIFEADRNLTLLVANEGAIAIDSVPGISVKYYDMVATKINT